MPINQQCCVQRGMHPGAGMPALALRNRDVGLADLQHWRADQPAHVLDADIQPRRADDARMRRVRVWKAHVEARIERIKNRNHGWLTTLGDGRITEAQVWRGLDVFDFYAALWSLEKHIERKRKALQKHHGTEGTDRVRLG